MDWSQHSIPAMRLDQRFGDRVVPAFCDRPKSIWAMVVDARRSSAVARALGATPGQVSAGLSGAQVLPALIGALLGIPGGFGLVNAVRHNAGSVITTPPNPSWCRSNPSATLLENTAGRAASQTGQTAFASITRSTPWSIRRLKGTS